MGCKFHSISISSALRVLIGANGVSAFCCCRWLNMAQNMRRNRSLIAQ